MCAPQVNDPRRPRASVLERIVSFLPAGHLEKATTSRSGEKATTFREKATTFRAGEKATTFREKATTFSLREPRGLEKATTFILREPRGLGRLKKGDYL